MVGDVHDDFLPSDRFRRRELDVSQLGRRLSANRWWLIGPTLACFVVSAVTVNVVSPRYTAETKILLESQETPFTRADRADAQAAPLPDDEAVQSQVQLVSSRDLARAAIRKLGLQGNPEFDPLANGVGLFSRLMVLSGLERDPLRNPPEERMLERYFDKLTVFPVTKSRVLTVEFESEDPDLAAKAANTVADLYIDIQSNAKRDAARQAADSLRTLITGLRVKAADAESKAQALRNQSGLTLGSNNTSITAQQLGDLSTQLAQARSAEAEAQAKAKLIRGMIKSGRIADVSDLTNSDLIRRLSEQRANVQAEMALQARTLLPGHPRMQELSAQSVDLDRQLRLAGEKAARGLDNDAQVAASRVDNLNAAMGAQREEIGASGGEQVKLNELDLNARLLKDQLEFNTSKYQEAVARENAVSTPADARVISRAMAPELPSFPKKLPIIAIATLAGALLSLGILIARELLSGRSFAAEGDVADLPVAVATTRAGRSAETSMPEVERVATAPTPAAVFSAAEPSAPASSGATDAPNLTAAREADAAVALRSSLPPAFGLDANGPRDPFLTMLDAVLEAKQTERALRILVCESDSASPAAPLAMRLGRILSRSFRVIAVDAAEGVAVEGGQSVEQIAGIGAEHRLGFGDLMAGQASFAEVIHRDAGSRLHFVSGALTEALRTDEDGVANLLDALAETYDFVVLSGPVIQDAAPSSLLLDHSDCVVLHASDSVGAERSSAVAALFHQSELGAPTLIVMGPSKLGKLESRVGAAA